MDGSSMDELLAEATDRGMFLVNNDSTEALFTEYDETLLKAEKLLEVEDPETNPFQSKYKARDMLDELAKKLEATKTIAQLEKNKRTIAAMDKRLASVQVRVGTISWECEEPHNAQTDLELACGYYFPGLVDRVAEQVEAAEKRSSETAAASGNPEQVGKVELSEADMQLPSGLIVLKDDLIMDAMKCLNLLGILWSGRGQLHKSLLYLLSAKSFYEMNSADPTTPDGNRSLSKTIATELGNEFTHNQFYLAQAYGHVGDTERAAHFCHNTLQRQHAAGLADSDIRSMLDWVKNCAGIGDFYLAMKQYNNCALALASAERILKEVAIPKILSSVADGADGVEFSREEKNFISGNINAAEIEAELHKRWVALDVLVLRRAFEAEKGRSTARELGVDMAEYEAALLAEAEAGELPDQDGENDFDITAYVEKHQQAAKQKVETVFRAAEAEAATAEAEAGGGQGQGDSGGQSAAQSLSTHKFTAPVEFFQGVAVVPTALLKRGSVTSYEDARWVFLRAAGRIEAAKKYYKLDGFVTDHVNLVQDHSKLYHYLSVFEADSKRKMAMQARRLEMLTPLLAALNRMSYEMLHKQVSYELGEAALAMVDMKLDKFRTRDPSGQGEVHVGRLKKAEVAKCNEYCQTALGMFAHFTNMYAPSSSARSTVEANKLCFEYINSRPLHEVATAACTEPDESLITEDEVRPFLNAHFLSCRLLSKVIPTPAFCPPNPAGAAAEPMRAHFLVCSLKRYQWLASFAVRICQKRGIDLKQCFGDEHNICEEMVRLLPSKIDRMCFLGEGGLSL